LTRTKVVLGVVVLAGVGLVVSLLGTRSGARAVVEGPVVPAPAVDPEAQRAQQDAWRKAVAPPAGAPQASAEPGPTSALEVRDQAAARVKASGPAEAGLPERAQAVGGAWAPLAKKLAIRAKIGPWECHAAGCMATIVHQSATEVATLANAVSRQDEFRSWKGQKMRSGPIRRPDGTTEITWFLYAADEAPRTQ
jgi:hypothetical protein